MIFLLLVTRCYSVLIAKHQIVVVPPASETVIRLNHYDDSSAASVSPTELTFTIETLPTDGDLYQLSSVFSKYGYEPKLGTRITTTGTVISGSDHRLIYKRRSPDSASTTAWSTFTFSVNNGVDMSYIATVTLVPSSGIIEGSTFLLGREDWTIKGNMAPTSAAMFESLSRGAELNHYILSNDDAINVPNTDSDDMDLWYFDAPTKFLGDKGIAYGGSLDFTLGAFSGDFAHGNSHDMTPVVRLTCDACGDPEDKGITLVYPLAALTSARGGIGFDGSATRLSVPLVEGRGWLRDPKNTLVQWAQASQCDVIQVLYRLSSIQILGDWTHRHETVALDDVFLKNTKTYVPLCAQDRPDASICSC